jgi:hypothetical protein
MKDNDENRKTQVSAGASVGRAQDIIRMIKERNNIQEDNSAEDDENFDEELAPDDVQIKESFHKFKIVGVAVNAMGLYRNIIEEIEFENDPKVLKAYFAERLGQVLEAIPDGIASAIDCNIKGLE